ncbi:MAG TPA: dephospho-CoA kinase [Acidimicrobiales bacterium]|nr:dephospho-CoA kinase [Acidimicrobiales bacterium]
MLVVGLTGGIGSGKSTVSALLAERGAVVVDADAIARQVVQPGGPAHDALVERFGTTDRPTIASIVFNDPAALADLNAIVHPAVGAEIARRLQDEAGTDHVVVLDIPLLVESKNPYAVAGVIVVDVPVDVAVSRLVEQRGMAEADVRARMAAQAAREERLAKADFVIDNAGTREHLAAEVERCWAWVRSLPTPP